MQLTLTIPALLFPAISLIMLAYTNRFLGLSSVVRTLHAQVKDQGASPTLHAQLRNLRYRLGLIKSMQFLGVLSFLIALLCMYFIYGEHTQAADLSFVASLILFALSLFISLLEILVSTRAIELELSDIEDPNITGIMDYLKNPTRKNQLPGM